MTPLTHNIETPGPDLLAEEICSYDLKKIDNDFLALGVDGGLPKCGLWFPNQIS
jgi:hypothetical protein